MSDGAFFLRARGESEVLYEPVASIGNFIKRVSANDKNGPSRTIRRLGRGLSLTVPAVGFNAKWFWRRP